MRPFRFSIAALALLCAGPLLAENVTQQWQVNKEYPLQIGGSFTLDNAAGNVDITVHDSPRLMVTATSVVTAINEAALAEGREQTRMSIGGDERSRFIKTLTPAIRTGAWSSVVHYAVRVPRTVHVKVTSLAADSIRVFGISGNVTVKSFSGVVVLDKVRGASTVETVNGSIVFDPLRTPEANAFLSTINGNIVVAVNQDANFEWIAETLRGDIRTTMPTRGSFVSRTTFRGGINAPGGPTVTTSSMMGNIFVLRRGTKVQQAESVRTAGLQLPRTAPNTVSSIPVIKHERVEGRFIYTTSLGTIMIGEARNDVRLHTGAGEVQVGTVLGEAYVTSSGGPLRIGNVLGPVTAKTEAGDVLVNAAREGGTITTGGGIIRLIYTGGPTTLYSGGGDIVVRQAKGPITAETKSGDINISIHPTSKTERVNAKTAKGNIVLNVSPKFAADVEATILTTNPTDTVISEVPGLSIRKEQVGGKTRIVATGKLNGGGEKVELYAENGGIQITTRAGNPITVISPQ